ncbi:MAG TPA: aminoacyl-tRNA hydrolase [Kofleriaceae bacterium]|nr:aminoacyl-tRNA hydrolase [Kofleriaceae bacterium]
MATTPDAPDSLSPTDADAATERTEPSPALRPAKQVIVMRKDLHMRKGKMIAQGAHASLKVVLDAGRPDPDTAAFTIALDPAMAAWLGGRFTKVCVSVDSEAALDAIVARARAAGVPCALIVDSGATEFHGVPTKTCCAVGPAWVDAVDAITGGLPLL